MPPMMLTKIRLQTPKAVVLGLVPFGNAPAVYGHGNCPGQRNNRPANGDTVHNVQNEVDQTEGFVLLGHGVGCCLSGNG